MQKEDCFLLGYISRTHGIEGELEFILDTDSPSNYKKLESVLVELNHSLVPFFIEKIRIQGNKAFAKLNGISTAEQALSLTKSSLFLPLSHLPELSEKQFYFHELKGFTVWDKTLGELGIITEVMDMPQQIIGEMTYKEKQVLFPLNDHTFGRVDRKTRILYVDLPEGLVDSYLF